MPVGLEHDPAADLERDRQHLAQPRLSFVGPPILEREDRQAVDDVLNLKVGVAGALEPRPRLEAEALSLGGPGAVVGNDPEPRGRLRLDPVAAEVLRELEAAAELRFRGREIVAHELRCDPEVTLADERMVVDFVRSDDRRAEVLDHLFEVSRMIGDERVQHEGHPDPKVRVVGDAREPLRLGETVVCLGRPSLPLVDVAEQEHRLALDVDAIQLRGVIGDLE